MTFEEYAELAQRTASTKTKEDKTGHGCLGLIGEAGEIIDIVKKRRYMGLTDELYNEKLIDEASDCLWYLVELCKGLSYKVDDVFWGVTSELYELETKPTGIYDAAISMLYAVVDNFDKDDVEQTVMNFRFTDMTDIANYILYILNSVGVTLEYAMEYNINKLSKRYPEHVFSADRSNERYTHGTD